MKRNEKMNDKIELSVELVNAILGYLQNKPYVEVSNMITRLLDEVKTSQESDVETLEPEE
jgi:hypothetical protein